MIKIKLVCKECGCVFIVEVYEAGEAEEKQKQTQPVSCRQCGCTNVDEY